MVRQINDSGNCKILNILSIGGSDPSSGAGIQSDIKSCKSLDAYCLTVITGVTAQNTTRFCDVEPVSVKILKQQLDAVISDFEIDAIKIGMVYSLGIIKAIFNALKKHDAPIVLDPVIKSTTGGMLIKKQAVSALCRYLVPISSMITPNKFEAEFLTDTKINSKRSAQDAAKKLQQMGAKNIVITGLETKNQIADCVLAGSNWFYLLQKKIPGVNRGSGCSYSLALCYALASKKSPKEAVQFAKQFAYDSIKNSQQIGRGMPVVQPWYSDGIYDELAAGISKFRMIKDIYKAIPQCQTNFVFSKKRPMSINDVIGVEGRIVRSGKNTIVAGQLKYGGSKHVASAVLEASKKFSSLRAAVNIKFGEHTISVLKKSKFVVLDYDRADEPRKVKIGGMSIRWGIKMAIQASKKPPDAIFHRGDLGKEPMIIIFGSTPAEVAQKLQRVADRAGFQS